MEETKKPEQTETKDKPKDKVEIAQEISDKLDKQITRLEELRSDKILGGESEAGQGSPAEETEDEKWAREAKVRYAGTGMDPTE